MDMKGFEVFTNDLVVLDEIVCTLTAPKSTVKFMGIGFKMNFTKSIVVKGLGNAKNVSIQQFSFKKSTKDHIIASVQAELFNPSVVSILPIGDLVFELIYKDVSVGEMKSNNVSFYAGINNLEMEGIIEPKDMAVASELIGKYFRGEPLKVTAKMISDSIPLYNKSLSSFSLTTTYQVLNYYYIHM